MFGMRTLPQKNRAHVCTLLVACAASVHAVALPTDKIMRSEDANEAAAETHAAMLVREKASGGYPDDSHDSRGRHDDYDYEDRRKSAQPRGPSARHRVSSSGRSPRQPRVSSSGQGGRDTPEAGQYTQECTVPMWTSKSYVCSEAATDRAEAEEKSKRDHLFEGFFVAWEDMRGIVRVNMPFDEPCTVQCPSWWQGPDITEIYCGGGIWMYEEDGSRPEPIREITCQASTAFNAVSAILLILVAGVAYLAIKKPETLKGLMGRGGGDASADASATPADGDPLLSNTAEGSGDNPAPAAAS